MGIFIPPLVNRQAAAPLKHGGSRRQKKNKTLMESFGKSSDSISLKKEVRD